MRIPWRAAPRAAPSSPLTLLVSLATALLVSFVAAASPGEVSFGQQQRAAPARAVVGSPLVLPADEPTAHLDRVSAPAAVRVLRRAADAGAAVLVAAHHDEVHRAADRTLVLSGGRLSVG